MPRTNLSTGSTAPRPWTVWAGALLVFALVVAYATVYVMVSRQEILAQNIEWIRTVAARLLP